MDHPPRAARPAGPGAPLAAAPRLPERLLERTLFASRWLLAPFYLGLALSLVALLIVFARRAVALLLGAFAADGNTLTVGILSLVDLSLMGNLVLMVIFAGYESFVSRLHVGESADRLDWMGQVGFGDLKLKLMASIVAISAIHVLEGFMDLGHHSDREMGWLVGVHLLFIVSAVLLALMDRLGERH